MNTNCTLILFFLILLGHFNNIQSADVENVDLMHIPEKTTTSIDSPNTIKDILKKTQTKGGVMNFNGVCLNKLFNIANLIGDNLGSDKGPIYSELLFPMISAYMGAPNICFGNYGTADFKSTNLANMTCAKIPVGGNYTYSLIGIYKARLATCSNKTISACIAFDDAGTVVFSINTNTLKCGMATAGMAKTMADISKTMKIVSYGFSPQRRFRKSINICYNDNNNVKCGDVTTQGHFYGLVNIALPEFKIGGHNLSTYLAINSDSTVMIDLGGVSSTSSSIVDSIKRMEGMGNSEDYNKIFEALKDLGAEYTYTLKGHLTLKLSEITKGFMKNLHLNIANLNFLATTGNGASGRKAGIYFRLKSDVLESLNDIIENLVDTYLGVFGLDIEVPDIKNLEVSLGVFIDTDLIGIGAQLTSAIKFQCFYNYKNNKGSCQLKDKFFSAIADGANWVLKSASKLWDEKGEQLTKFERNLVFHSVAAQKAKEKWSAIRNAAKKAAKAAKKKGKEAAKKATETAKKAAKAVEKATDAAVKKVAEVARKAKKAFKKAFPW